MKQLVVAQERLWSWRKGALIAAIVAATSVTAVWLYALFAIPRIQFIPSWIGMSLMLALGLAYPVGVVVASYTRICRPRILLVYVLAYGLAAAAVSVAIDLSQQLRYPLGTTEDFILQQAVRLPVTFGIASAVNFFAWAICRLVRGKPLINDGSLCAHCGYNLTGNVSGICPECGTKIEPP